MAMFLFRGSVSGLLCVPSVSGLFPGMFPGYVSGIFPGGMLPGRMFPDVPVYISACLPACDWVHWGMFPV